MRYLTCNTLVTTNTSTNTQVIQYSNASKNIVDNRLDSALVESTVYPPNSAQMPTSIPMKRLSQRGERDRRTRIETRTALMSV